MRCNVFFTAPSWGCAVRVMWWRGRRLDQQWGRSGVGSHSCTGYGESGAGGGAGWVWQDAGGRGPCGVGRDWSSSGVKRASCGRRWWETGHRSYAVGHVRPKGHFGARALQLQCHSIAS